MQTDALPGQHRVAYRLAQRGFESPLHAYRMLVPAPVDESPYVLAGQQHAFVPRKLGGGAWTAVPTQVVGRGAQHAPIRGQLARDQTGIVQGADADGEVEARAYHVHHFVAEVGVQAQLRMPREE